ncbi:undecaprenyl-diphosphate phosphatase [Candidatus Dependentiae bacterium]|nr:undecaprenyl-diphosphate phosphatase [Candidatus Dependentiae bacterium]
MQTVLILLFFQIVFESLPVSSSGHIFIIKKFLSLSFSKKTFDLLDHISHGPTLLIIMFLFRNDWGFLFRKLFRFQVARASYKKLISLFVKIVQMVFVVDCITAIFYILIKILLADSRLLSSDIVLWLGLLVTGIGLLSLHWLPERNQYESWNMRQAMLLGCVQGLALLPGISRFGATYVASRWFKLSPRRAFQISFLIYVPLIAAAFLRAGVTILFKKSHEVLLLKSVLFSWQGFLVGAVATICAYGALALVRQFAHQKKFWRFGFYLLALGVLFLLQSVLLK